MKGTYRRNYDGDYLCREEEVRGMFADQQDSSYDANVVEDLGMDALNSDTLKGYRIRFESLNPAHPWNKLPLDEYLK
ncbi:MAG: ATPase [Lachnospiraceae bacterium]|nr:ATPase [Lachnospiraceae bacterium]